MEKTVYNTLNYDILADNLTGRKVLLTSLTDLTVDNVANVIKFYYDAHMTEVPVMQFLYRYDLGIQPILQKERDAVNSDSNNKIVVNLARTARKIMQSAFLGEQLQYISKSGKDNEKEAVAALKYMYDQEDEAEHNVRLEHDRGIVGIAYEFVGLDSDLILDDDNSDTPIVLSTLSPLRTRIVYHNGIKKTPVFAFTYYSIYDIETQQETGYAFQVYTLSKVFTYNTNTNGVIQGEVTEIDNPTRRLPINEYINNEERMGDFEGAVGVLNAINNIFSKRVDNISDIVDSFLVWVNCSIFDTIVSEDGKTITYDDTKLKAFKKNKAIEIKGESGLPADLKHVVMTLDQSQVEILTNTLTKYAFAIMGVPNPINVRATGSSDSAEAVNTNEGWKTLEDLLKTKERYFRKSLKNRIKTIKRLALFDKSLQYLNAAKIDIKFIRTKALNTQSNAQALDTLRKTGYFTEETLISLSNLVENPAAEVEEKANKLSKLLSDGVIDKKQYGMVKLALLYPSIDISKISGEITNDINNGELLNGVD